MCNLYTKSRSHYTLMREVSKFNSLSIAEAEHLNA
jgi:hypothetical protein